jgi:hypothetical protein
LSQRRAIAGKKYLLSGDHQRLSELDQQIAAFQSGIADQADSQQSLEEPGGIPPEAFGERLPIGYIGGKGQPNRMVWPEPAARIKVRSPSGKLGSIPESQLDEALRSGYSRVQ